MGIETVFSKRGVGQLPRKSAPMMVLCSFLLLGPVLQTNAQESSDNEAASQRIIAEIRRVGALSAQQVQKAAREQRGNNARGNADAAPAKAASAQNSPEVLSALLEKQQFEQDFSQSLLDKADALESRLNYLLWAFVVAFLLAMIGFMITVVRLLKRSNNAGGYPMPIAEPVKTQTEPAPLSEQDHATQQDGSIRQTQNLPAPSGSSGSFNGFDKDAAQHMSKQPESSVQGSGRVRGGIPRSEYGDILSRMVLQNAAEFMSRH